MRKQNPILLAEDNAINQQVTTHILGRLGYSHVAIANNGIEAIEAFAKQNYDLILMDCEMPEMDGYSATGTIRQIEASKNLKHIPVIAMTAHALKEDKEICLKAGMDDYISKPFGVSQLDYILSWWLSNNNSSKTTVNMKNPVANKILDLERLHMIFGNNERVKQEFLVSFLSNTQNLLKEIGELISQNNEFAAKAKCHRLKGTCGNAGANLMYEFAMKQEEMVIEKNWQGALELQRQLLIALEEVEQFAGILRMNK
jgi:CheY-like chemotaxis protein